MVLYHEPARFDFEYHAVGFNLPVGEDGLLHPATLLDMPASRWVVASPPLAIVSCSGGRRRFVPC
jgi:hypothetical protein